MREDLGVSVGEDVIAHNKTTTCIIVRSMKIRELKLLASLPLMLIHETLLECPILQISDEVPLGLTGCS